MALRAYVGLGGNLGNPVGTLSAALRDLGRLPATRCVRASGFYRNPPVGPQDQGDYVNAVAELETRLEPLLLLRWLLTLERRHGRIRGRRWGERTLDLDLLLYGVRQIRTRELILPHPRLHCRSFVVHPLAELAPGLSIPGRGALSHWRLRCSPRELRRVSNRFGDNRTAGTPVHGCNESVSHDHRNKKIISHGSWKNRGGPGGLEPTTKGLGVPCSNR